VAYRKLTRKKRTLFGSTQLWLEDDHVLMVRSTRFQEEYRRFQLADIQALVAVETPVRIWLIAVLAINVGLSLLGLFGSPEIFGRTFFAVSATMLFGLIVYELVRGQRCRCRLLTEVSSEVLDPVTRISDYRRLLADLGPALEAAQGILPVDEQQLAALKMREAFVKPDEQGPEGASRYLPHTFFGVLLLNAALLALFYYLKYEEGLALSISVFMGELALSGLLLLRSKRFGIEGGVRTIVGVAAVLLVLDLISGVGQGGYLIYSIAEAGRNKTVVPTFWTLPWIMLLGRISMGWRFFVGLTGFALLWMSSRPPKEAQPSQL
jgi:hypothetical protein